MKFTLKLLTLSIGIFMFSGCSKDLNTEDIPQQFKDFATVFDGQGIGGIININWEIQVLINRDGDKYAWFEQDKVQKEWNLQDDDGPFRNINVDHIETGMILQWNTNPDNLYIIYNGGNNYMNCTINGDPAESGNWNNTDFYFDDYRGHQDVKSKWGQDGTFPLDDIGATMRTNYIGCLDDIKIENEEYLIVDQEGKKLTNYIVSDLNSRGEVEVSNIVNFVGAGCPPDNHKLPITKIGAATIYDAPDHLLYLIYFSEDGKSFCYYKEDSRLMSEVFSF